MARHSSETRSTDITYAIEEDSEERLESTCRFSQPILSLPSQYDGMVIVAISEARKTLWEQSNLPRRTMEAPLTCMAGGPYLCVTA